MLYHSVDLTSKISFFLCAIFFITSCSTKTGEVHPSETGWVDLIDENLSEWDTYLSFQHSDDYDGTPPMDAAGKKIEPIGLNKPGYSVFTTQTIDDEMLIRVSGEYYGCIATKQEYENYHFQLKYKWGDKKWIPRLKKMKDSGILYHSVGDFGVEHWRSWMMSQEFQIMEAHTGDFWSQATSAIDIRAIPSESGLNPMAHSSYDFLSFGENGEAGKYCLRYNNYENEPDEWNTLELVCYQGKSLHIVNGEVVMVLKNSRYFDENGNAVPMTKGKIQLQSEAAELFYKDIKIRPLERLSKKHLEYF